ncbi:MAG: diguanylate cyclase domain-containing protein [Oscillospiraceae bacterium]
MALVFLDLDGLKHTNDHFGHGSGRRADHRRSPLLIERAFGFQGRCYRIGGDEFAVIPARPGRGERIWNERLDQAIRDYNQGSRYPLSIARGVSYLRDGDRGVKRGWATGNMRRIGRCTAIKSWRQLVRRQRGVSLETAAAREAGLGRYGI